MNRRGFLGTLAGAGLAAVSRWMPLLREPDRWVDVSSYDPATRTITVTAQLVSRPGRDAFIEAVEAEFAAMKREVLADFDARFGPLA